MNCEHFTIKLEESDRYYVDHEDCNNCLFCVIKRYGKMTQEQVSEILNISKMRVSQVEKAALRKVEKRTTRRGIILLDENFVL